MFYKLVMNGSCQGQDIRNILYYRTTSILSEIDFPFAGAQALAENWVQEIWPALRPVMNEVYTLETVDVYPINDEFELIYQMPHSLAVGEAGTETRDLAGPALCANFKFVLGPTSIINGLVPPRRGYCALGPITPAIVGQDGYINAATMNGSIYQDAANALHSNVEQVLPVPNVWSPVRLKQSRILGGLVHWESYAPVVDCVVSRRASFRRSRLPES